MRDPRSNGDRSRALANLGRYIVRGYNNTCGIFSYDPDGFMADVYGEIDRIFEPELSAIRQEAEVQRELLRMDAQNLMLEFQEAIEAVCERAFQEMDLALRDYLSGKQDPDSLREQMRAAIFNIPVGMREEMQMPLAAFDRSRGERVRLFEDWLSRHYG